MADAGVKMNCVKAIDDKIMTETHPHIRTMASCLASIPNMKENENSFQAMVTAIAHAGNTGQLTLENREAFLLEVNREIEGIEAQGNTPATTRTGKVCWEHVMTFNSGLGTCVRICVRAVSEFAVQHSLDKTWSENEENEHIKELVERIWEDC